MGRIFCLHGLCSSNTVDREVGVKLIPFPKPCAEYINSTLIKNTNDHEPQQCAKCSKTLRWIQLCNRTDSKLQGLLNVNKRSYVCSKHFSNGIGPTETDPDPFPATSVRKPQPVRGVRKVKSAKQFRLSTNSASPPHGTLASKVSVKPESSFENGVNKHIFIQRQPTTDDQRLTNSVFKTIDVSLICSRSRQEDCDPLAIIYANQEHCKSCQKLTILQHMANKLGNHGMFNKYENEKLTVIFLGSNALNQSIEKTCVVDEELDVQIFVLGKAIDDDSKIWSKYPKKWNEDFDYLSFFKDFSVNWKVCQAYTDSHWISKAKESPQYSDSYRYDRITDSVRSLDCVLLATSDVCFYCNKMKRNLRAKLRKRPCFT